MSYFAFFDNYYETLKDLPDDILAHLTRALMEYMFDDVEPDLDPVEKAIFQGMRVSFDKSKKRSKAGQTKSNDNKNEIKTETNDNQNEIKQESNDEQTGVRKKERKKERKNPPISPQGDDDVAIVVEYMNDVCGTNYRATSDATRKHIKARLEDGFTVDDCKRVIDNKARDWIGTDYAKYLRPGTLFIPSKFEAYLNQQGRREVDWSEL